MSHYARDVLQTMNHADLAARCAPRAAQKAAARGASALDAEMALAYAFDVAEGRYRNRHERRVFERIVARMLSVC